MADNMVFAPTIVSSSANVIGVNSPFHVQIGFGTGSFTHVALRLWTWSTNLNDPYSSSIEPNVILYKRKVNDSDSTVLFELSEYVRDTIDPKFVYASASLPSMSNNTVYFKYEYDIINNPDELPSTTALTQSTSPTFLGTLGYNWNYEGERTIDVLSGSYGFGQSTNPPKNFNSAMTYAQYSYALTSSATPDTNISWSIFTPSTSSLVCSYEDYLIVYLNRAGFWNYFTPTGKTMHTEEITKEKYNKTVRNPLSIVYGRDHMIRQFNTTVKSKIVVNTGILPEKSGQYIEEIVYSPKVYLIEFQKTTSGGKYTSFIQRPVIVTNSDLLRKTRLNDKSKTSYNIEFEDTSNKILNNR